MAFHKTKEYSMRKKHTDFKYNITPVSHKIDSETVVLVLHGYLSSSQSMIYINNALIKNNYSIESPNLLGHGTVYT